MADPVWPTEPWYVTHHRDRGREGPVQAKTGRSFIEHSHRIAGWAIGVLDERPRTSACCWSEPRKSVRWVSLVGLARADGGVRAVSPRHDGPAQTGGQRTWSCRCAPVGTTVTGLAAHARRGDLRASSTSASRRRPPACTRRLALVGGDDSGLTRRLPREAERDLVGADLAGVPRRVRAVVFGLLVSVAVLARGPDRTKLLVCRGVGDGVRAPRSSCKWSSAAWLRHFRGAMPQRLHFLTALARRPRVRRCGCSALSSWIPHARSRGGWVAWALAGLLACCN